MASVAQTVRAAPKIPIVMMKTSALPINAMHSTSAATHLIRQRAMTPAAVDPPTLHQKRVLRAPAPLAGPSANAPVTTPASTMDAERMDAN